MYLHVISWAVRTPRDTSLPLIHNSCGCQVRQVGRVEHNSVSPLASLVFRCEAAYKGYERLRGQTNHRAPRLWNNGICLRRPIDAYHAPSLPMEGASGAGHLVKERNVSQISCEQYVVPRHYYCEPAARQMVPVYRCPPGTPTVIRTPAPQHDTTRHEFALFTTL